MLAACHTVAVITSLVSTSIRYSLGYSTLSPFCLLHLACDGCRLLNKLVPPLDLGLMWSTLISSLFSIGFRQSLQSTPRPELRLASSMSLYA